MTLKRTKHAVYDIKYHFVWIPKYRKDISTKEIKNRVAELFKEIAIAYEFEIDTMDIMEDHVDCTPRTGQKSLSSQTKGLRVLL